MGTRSSSGRTRPSDIIDYYSGRFRDMSTFFAHSQKMVRKEIATHSKNLSSLTGPKARAVLAAMFWIISVTLTVLELLRNDPIYSSHSYVVQFGLNMVVTAGLVTSVMDWRKERNMLAKWQDAETEFIMLHGRALRALEGVARAHSSHTDITLWAEPTLQNIVADGHRMSRRYM